MHSIGGGTIILAAFSSSCLRRSDFLEPKGPVNIKTLPINIISATKQFSANRMQGKIKWPKFDIELFILPCFLFYLHSDARTLFQFILCQNYTAKMNIVVRAFTIFSRNKNVSFRILELESRLCKLFKYKLKLRIFPAKGN